MKFHVIQFGDLIFDVKAHDFVEIPNENCVFPTFDTAYDFMEQELDGVGSVARMEWQSGVVSLYV